MNLHHKDSYQDLMNVIGSMMPGTNHMHTLLCPLYPHLRIGFNQVTYCRVRSWLRVCVATSSFVPRSLVSLRGRRGEERERESVCVCVCYAHMVQGDMICR